MKNRPKIVAKRIVESIGKGKPIALSTAIKEAGYSHNTAHTPANVTNTKEYQTEMARLISEMETERDRALKSMKTKISKARYRDLSDAIDKLQKNINLLGGKSTDKSDIVIRWE